MLCSLSTKLGQQELHAITTLEEELGHPILAFSCHSLAAADLTTEQLARIQELEAKLDLALVAVEA